MGIGKGGESCRRKKGKRIVEERRGRISEGSIPAKNLSSFMHSAIRS